MKRKRIRDTQKREKPVTTLPNRDNVKNAIIHNIYFIGTTKE
jgi:hypothetical protein